MAEKKEQDDFGSRLEKGVYDRYALDIKKRLSVVEEEGRMQQFDDQN